MDILSTTYNIKQFPNLQDTKLHAYTTRIRIKKAFLGMAIVIVLQTVLLNGLCQAYNRETPIVNAVRRVGPAVVNISSEVAVRKRANPFSGFNLNPFFDNFFKDFFDPHSEHRPNIKPLKSPFLEPVWCSIVNANGTTPHLGHPNSLNG